ncbi:hypothetical protein [Dyella subtropica]|nr:hypothetical protein [Dyella subtropica]
MQIPVVRLPVLEESGVADMTNAPAAGLSEPWISARAYVKELAKR